MSCGIFLTYPLVMYPAVEILLPVIFKVFKASSGKSELIYELGFRYMLVAITCKYILGLFVGPWYSSWMNSIYNNNHNHCKNYSWIGCRDSKNWFVYFANWSGKLIYLGIDCPFNHSYDCILGRFRGYIWKVKDWKKHVPFCPWNCRDGGWNDYQCHWYCYIFYRATRGWKLSQVSLIIIEY